LIPIIDLSRLRHNPADPQLVKALDTALVETGFCYLSMHGIAPRLIERAQAAALTFFSHSPEYKAQYDISRATRHSGYVSFGEKGLYQDEAQRMYEAFDIGLELPANDADYLAGNIFYGPNTWPDIIGFRTAVYGYYEAVRELSQLLSQTIEVALGLAPHSLQRMMQKPTAQMRLIHYPANHTQPRAAASHANMGAHTDYEFFTLLYQTKPGLQTVNMAGEWVDAPPMPNTLVMNVGDLAEVISGGRYRSNPHRVLNTGEQRFSMPFFAAFDYDAVIQPMLPIVNSRQYPPLQAGAHLLQQVTSDFSYLRQRAQSAVPSHYNNPFLLEKLTCHNQKPF
jgi:isopenicillin N synthase-like dioxygenase